MATSALPAKGPQGRPPDILPTLFGGGYGTYPVQPKNYLYSLLIHCAALAGMLALIAYINNHKTEIKQQFTDISLNISPYILSPGTQSGGGGGGGTHEKLDASKGALPRMARDQFTPPTVVVREEPKLPIPPTVVAPQIKMAAMDIGDPLAKMVPPSNGTGGETGIGNGNGTGVGSGRGPGVGEGWGGGVGGGAYRVGGGVSAPRAIYSPDPEYSEEARKAKYQGTVVLWIVVGPDGRVHDESVRRALGMGLDEKAMEAVKQWKFEPAKKDGQPVAVQVSVEVSFRLY